MKTCIKCGTEKPLDLYPLHKTCKDGRAGTCKKCSADYGREWRRKQGIGPRIPGKGRAYTARAMTLRKYGLTPETYDAMLALQGGLCAICQDECPSDRTLAVDHCHETGRVRGLLCIPCNMALGGFRDRPEVMKRAIDYVEYV